MSTMKAGSSRRISRLATPKRMQVYKIAKTSPSGQWVAVPNEMSQMKEPLIRIPPSHEKATTGLTQPWHIWVERGA